MKQEEILSGKAGLAGLQRVLNGQSSRRLLRSEVQAMLRQGYSAGPFHLTRAKFKPGRKLSAYFTFPARNGADRPTGPVAPRCLILLLILSTLLFSVSMKTITSIAGM